MNSQFSRARWWLLRRWGRVRRRLRKQSQQNWAAQRRTDLESALSALGIPRADAAKILGALRSWRPAPELVVIGFGIFLAMAVVWQVFTQAVDGAARAVGWHAAEQAVANYRWLIAQADAGGTGLGPGSWAALCLLLTLWVAPPIVWCAQRSTSFRYTFVLRCVDSVIACAKADATLGPSRARALRRVDEHCQIMERHLFRVHRASRSVARRSPRNAPIKRHAALVAGAQRDALRRIDVDPRQALRDLARLQISMAENYLDGRLAALVPADRLQGVQPVSRLRSQWRESAQVSVAILAAMGAATGAARLFAALGVGDGLMPWLVLGAAVLAAVVVAGWGRVSGLVQLMRG
ncbi:hypothetical protein [Streptomyces beihaiensis]|uniref:Uncharacterized protein n=1 Tax=Streptomyces beihaiensis TaxID=2984495 RepID=A0ABT3TWU7_9ACTN|nr:hypothetical protein [Streptomyces beihaiensis]MCX3061522.1 hypothetical protein [Streptomyces beihaiensis]